jgi:hypothetical protein
MNAATTLLLVMLSGEGYWFSGRAQTVQVQWNVKEPVAAAAITWRLECGGAQLASGRVVLPVKDRTAKIRLTLPEVRVPTEMQFVYRAEQAGAAKAIAEGSLPVHVYPKTLLAGVAERAKGKQLLVWDRPEGLPALLKAAGVEYTLVRKEADLQFLRPDVIVVGPEQLGRETEGQGKLLNLAHVGASVLVFRQTQLSKLAGYAVVRRAPPAKLDWLADHLLTRHSPLFEPCGIGPDAWAVQLPADEAAQEIAWWPREAAGDEPAPIDALVLVKALGKGRIVLCQVPLGRWDSDPRSQLFLADVLDYLASPVVPTPSPSRRPKPEGPAAKPKVPSIGFSP